MNKIVNDLNETKDIIEKIVENQLMIAQISDIADTCSSALKGGNKILLAGNGGSASDSQHVAGELISRFLFDRPGLPAIALTTDSSVLTAIGNDYGYENIFERQIESLGNSGDIFFAFSTSGKSKNIIKGLEIAAKKKITCIGLTGLAGSYMASICDFCITIPSLSTPKIQECHIIIAHIICGLIESSLFSNKN